MNILLVAENWPPRTGGIERYLVGLAAALSENHSMTVIAPGSDSKGRHDISGVQVIRKRFFWPFIRPAWLPLFIFLYRYVQRQKVDYIICGKGLFEGLLGFYIKKYLNVQYAVCTYAMEVSDWLDRPRTRRKLTRALLGADIVTAINAVTRKQLVDIGISDDVLLTLYPGIGEKFLQRLGSLSGSDAKTIMKKYGISSRYILAVGRLIERKGFDDLICAYAKLDQVKFGDVQLVIIGDGPQLESLKKVADQEFVRPLFLTDVSDDELPALFREAELFALTPKEVSGDIEGFGIVYLEAAAAGLAVFGTKTGGVPEAVIDRNTGLLVESQDVDGIRNAVSRLLEDSALAARLGAAGKERVLNEYTWKERIHQLEEVFGDQHSQRAEPI